MTLLGSAFRAPTLSKFSGFLKASLGPLGALLVLFSGGFSSVAAETLTLGLRVPIAEQVPLNPAEKYVLEVAKDPGFAEILLKAEVLGNALAWDAPAEGVYHWRLSRLAKAKLGGDVLTFVSGSVVAIDSRLERKTPPRLTWGAVPGADRYRLRIISLDGTKRQITTKGLEYVVPSTYGSVSIDLLAYTGERRTQRDFQFNPSLKLDPGLPPPPPPPPPPTSEAPPPTPEVAPPPASEPPAKVVREPIGARHMVGVFALLSQETLRLTKLEIGLSSKDYFFGGGASLWTQPMRPLVLSGEVSYFRHVGDTTQPDVLGDQEVTLDNDRLTARGGLGYNILSAFDVEDHVLALSLGGAVVRMPLLPKVYAVGSGEALDASLEDRPLVGGLVTYGYFGRQMGMTLEGGHFINQDEDSRLSEGRLRIHFMVGDHGSFDLGGYARLTQFQTCAGDTTTCLVEGKVTTESRETAGTLGYALRL